MTDQRRRVILARTYHRGRMHARECGLSLRDVVIVHDRESAQVLRSMELDPVDFTVLGDFYGLRHAADILALVQSRVR